MLTPGPLLRVREGTDLVVHVIGTSERDPESRITRSIRERPDGLEHGLALGGMFHACIINRGPGKNP